jgi:hypothetical protein
VGLHPLTFLPMGGPLPPSHPRWRQQPPLPRLDRDLLMPSQRQVHQFLIASSGEGVGIVDPAAFGPAVMVLRPEAARADAEHRDRTVGGWRCSAPRQDAQMRAPRLCLWRPAVLRPWLHLLRSAVTCALMSDGPAARRCTEGRLLCARRCAMVGRRPAPHLAWVLASVDTTLLCLLLCRCCYAL